MLRDGLACAESWLNATGNIEGCVMDLPTLRRLAAHWYDDPVDHGYTRREPAAAGDYLRSVGFAGSFWGI